MCPKRKSISLWLKTIAIYNRKLDLDLTYDWPSQRIPVQPCIQLHVKSSTSSEHWPPLRHGFGWQRSRSEEKKNNSDRSYWNPTAQFLSVWYNLLCSHNSKQDRIQGWIGGDVGCIRRPHCILWLINYFLSPEFYAFFGKCEMIALIEFTLSPPLGLLLPFP